MRFLKQIEVFTNAFEVERIFPPRSGPLCSRSSPRAEWTLRRKSKPASVVGLSLNRSALRLRRLFPPLMWYPHQTEEITHRLIQRARVWLNSDSCLHSPNFGVEDSNLELLHDWLCFRSSTLTPHQVFPGPREPWRYTCKIRSGNV